MPKPAEHPLTDALPALAGAGISVRGRAWNSNATVRAAVAEGSSLEDALRQAASLMRRDGGDAAWVEATLRHCRCRLDGADVPRERWAVTFPAAHSRVEFFVAPRGGGGGGKNPLAFILQIVVVAASIWAGPALAGAMGLVTSTGALTAGGLAVAGLTSAGIMLLGGLVQNWLFPVAKPRLTTSDAGKDSPTYAVNGARNAANPYGYVPLVLGRHKHTPPLGAKSWNAYEGGTQYFHMLVVWGHPDMEVTDFKIGDTPLSNFRNVTHVFHQSTTGEDLRLFGKSVNEQAVGATLKASGGYVTRSLGECDEILFVLAANALCTVDPQSGTPGWRTVDISAEYRREGEAEWRPISGKSFPIPGRMVATYRFFMVLMPGRIYVGQDGVIQQTYLHSPVPEGCYEIYPNKNPYIVGCNVSYGKCLRWEDYKIGKDNWSRRCVSQEVIVSDGYYSEEGIIHFSGAQTKPLTLTRRFAVPHGKYEMRWLRHTPDSNSQYIYDEISVVMAQAIVNRPPFRTPLPMCVSELRIQASDQLSGYVDNFNAVCQSVVPDYNPPEEAWIWRPTSNPASLMRYVLTSRHGLNAPYGEAKIDDASFVEWHQFCEAQDLRFDFVCDAEEELWPRLTQLADAGRAGVTLDNDGKYGVAIDRSGKEPVQLLTPRNSWGLTIHRTFTKIPHALRVKFVNAERDWEQDEGFVYADGYDQSNATDIREWDFPGKTRWAEVWRHGRRHLAKMLLRPLSVSVSMDWEWRLCRRGDLVGVASDVLMNVFGTARIQRLAYDVEGELVLAGREQDIPTDVAGQPLIPVGLELDDTVVFSDPAPARYGIAVRNAQGGVNTHEIVPQYGGEASLLMFRHALSRAQIPPLQALVSVSILGDEYAEYLLASVAPGDDMSAELSLIPYAGDELDRAVDGPVPPWTPPIHLDGIGTGEAIPAPIITEIRSDESVLIRSGTGTAPRIAVWWTLPAGGTDGLTLRLRAAAEGEEYTGSGTSGDEFIAVQGVREGRAYEVRLRAVDRLGRASPWSAPLRHVVVGRTTPPPAPSGVFLDGYSLRIEQKNRPLDVVGHKVWMAMDEADGIGMALELTTPYTTTGAFDLRPWAGRARAVFVRTVDELGLLSEPVRVAVNLGDALPDNVLFEFSERERQWPGEITGGYVAGNTLWSEERAALWPQDDHARLWPQDDRLPLWPSGAAETLTYVWRVDIPQRYAGSRVLVLPEAVSGRLRSLEFRHYTSGPLWPQDDAARLWPQGSDAPLWPQPVVSAWEAMPDNYVSPGAETLEFRVTYADAEAARLPDIRTVLDVEDRELALEDVAVAAAGTRVEVPPHYFRGITNVQLTLQYVQGSAAQSVQRVRGTEIMGPDGYLTEGPLLRAFDAAGKAVAASCDVRIQGY